MINWENIKLPKGVTQDEFLEDIYEICHIKAYQHSQKTGVKFLSREDLKQEYIMKCFRSLKSFDPSKSYDAEKGKWKLYFYRACDSMQKDIEKKFTFNRNLPCRNCPLFDKETKKCKEYGPEFKTQCTLYFDYLSLQQSKWALGSLYGTGGAASESHTERLIDIDSDDRAFSDCSERVVDLYDYIESKCSSDIQRVFKDLCDVNYDTKQMPKADLKKLRKELKGKFDWS